MQVTLNPTEPVDPLAIDLDAFGFLDLSHQVMPAMPAMPGGSPLGTPDATQPLVVVKTDTRPVLYRKALFLSGVRLHFATKDAAEYAGIRPHDAYRWRRDDPEFAAAWELAKDETIDKVEAALVQRAIEHDTKAAIFILQGRRADVYGKATGQENQADRVIYTPLLPPEMPQIIEGHASASDSQASRAGS